MQQCNNGFLMNIGNATLYNRSRRKKPQRGLRKNKLLTDNRIYVWSLSTSKIIMNNLCQIICFTINKIRLVLFQRFLCCAVDIFSKILGTGMEHVLIGLANFWHDCTCTAIYSFYLIKDITVIKTNKIYHICTNRILLLF